MRGVQYPPGLWEVYSTHLGMGGRRIYHSGIGGIPGYIPPYVHPGVYTIPGIPPYYTTLGIPRTTPVYVCVPCTALGVRSVRRESPGLKLGERGGCEAQRALPGPKGVKVGRTLRRELLRSPRKNGWKIG